MSSDKSARIALFMKSAHMSGMTGEAGVDMAKARYVAEEWERAEADLSGKRGMTGDELKAARKILGLTQQQLAETLGISASRIKDYERGSTRGTERPAPVPRLVEIALKAIQAGFSCC